MISLVKDGLSMLPTVLLANVTSPNSLFLDTDLYVLDGESGVIYKCSVKVIEGKPKLTKFLFSKFLFDHDPLLGPLITPILDLV